MQLSLPGFFGRLLIRRVTNTKNDNEMKAKRRHILAAVIGFGASALMHAGLARAPSADPEDVGLSSERLERINELVERHIEAGSFSGAVTLVARNGYIAHHEAHGLMDLEQDRSMVVAVPRPAPAGPFGGGPGAGGQSEPRYYTVPAERPVTVRDLLTHTTSFCRNGCSIHSTCKTRPTCRQTGTRGS